MRLKKTLSLLCAAAVSLQLLAVPALAASNQEQIWNYLRGQGLSQPAVAGIMGNLEAESNYLPNNLENASNKKCGLSDAEFTALVDDGTITRAEFARSDTYGVYSNRMYGYGLAQWTWYTLKEGLYDFAKARGTSIADLTMQLDYLLQSALSMKKLAGYQNATDVSAATVLFHNVYENSNSTAAMIAKRVVMAQAVFQKYGDASVHFRRGPVYQNGRFTDVTSADWFDSSVASAYELGLMNGTSDTLFTPMGNVTLAQAITMAARVHSIYPYGDDSFVESGTWYKVYLDYAYENGIIDKAIYQSDMSRDATRAQFAVIFANALPADGLISINVIADDAIPDVKSADAIGPAVYKLYRAGILTGNDQRGTFQPQKTITRAAAAAIVARMGESDARKSVKLT